MAMQHGCPDWTALRPFRYHRQNFNSALATFANAHGSLLRAIGNSQTNYADFPGRAERGSKQVMPQFLIWPFSQNGTLWNIDLSGSSKA
jgi:hypothetical protein